MAYHFVCNSQADKVKIMKSLLIKILLLVSLLAGSLLLPLSASAAIDCTNPSTPQDQIQCGACGASGSTNCDSDTSAAPSSLQNTISDIINIMSILVGVISVIMVIVGGFRFVTSGGNAESTKAARNTILYALVGLVVVALAQLIVHFVLNRVS